MAHFAHVTNEVVDSVININEDTIENKGGWLCPSCGEFKPLSEWFQTSYNTQGGVHTLGGTPFRKNFAGIGFTYDSVRDAFIPPQPFPSWTLNEDTCHYEPPFPMPADGNYYEWDEKITDWVIIPK